MSFKRMLPRPAMIVAVVALIAALGGSAYAATKIGTDDIQNNAITARQVENGTLKGKDFKEGGLTSSDVRDGKLKLEDLSDATVKSLKPRWLLLERAGPDRGAVRWLHRHRRLLDERQRLHRRR